MINKTTRSSSKSATIKYIHTHTHTHPMRELEQYITCSSLTVVKGIPRQIYSFCRLVQGKPIQETNIPLNVSIKILSKFPPLNDLVQPHPLNLNVKTGEINRSQMIIQLKYILDVP